MHAVLAKHSLNTDDLTDSSKIKEAIKKGVNDANEGDGGDTVVEDAAGDEGDDYDGYEDYNFNFYQGQSISCPQLNGAKICYRAPQII